MNSNNCSQAISVLVIMLSIISICEAGITKTDLPMKCHICDPESCKTYDKKSKPQECSAERLELENNGPSKLANFSYWKFNRIDLPTPRFVCQKIEAYDRYGNREELRKCQMWLSKNDSCTSFHREIEKDPLRTYNNASCFLCDDRDGCNNGGFLYVWLPLLLSSIIISLLF